MVKKRVMISSIYSGNTFNSMIAKLSPTEIILVIEKNLEKLGGKEPKEKKESIKKLKENFGEIINISEIKTSSLYDLYGITKDVVRGIDKIKEGEIILNISEGRKPLSFGISLAGYLRRGKVNAIYYLIKETNDFLKMPFLNFSVNKVQTEILKKLKNSVRSIKELKESLNKSKSVFYQYLKELEKDGYIEIEEEKIKISELGRIAIL